MPRMNESAFGGKADILIRSYPPEARVQIYEDDYTLGPKYRWRDAREGRGYYRGGVWIGF